MTGVIEVRCAPLVGLCLLGEVKELTAIAPGKQLDYWLDGRVRVKSAD